MNRRDFSLAPPGETLLDALEAAGIDRSGVGKVDDLFARRGIVAQHTADNAEGIRLIVKWLQGTDSGLLAAIDAGGWKCSFERKGMGASPCALRQDPPIITRR